jgi:hypothetical protein
VLRKAGVLCFAKKVCQIAMKALPNPLSPSLAYGNDFCKAGPCVPLLPVLLSAYLLIWFMRYPEGNECSLSRMFGHCTVEVLRMRWLKRDIWKASITIAGMLLLLILVVWVPVSAVGAYEGTSELFIAGPVQTTPTEDATVTALNKEKLKQEVTQLTNQNDRSITAWLWNFIATVGTVVVALVAIFGVLWTIWSNAQKDRKDRKDAQEGVEGSSRRASKRGRCTGQRVEGSSRRALRRAYLTL